MIEVALTYSTSGGSREIEISRTKTSLGRGDVDHRIDDDGLSRSNSIVYRDGDRVWIVDDNSTNGTFVNGMPVAAAGTPLRNGDVIKIGNRTNLKVLVADEKKPAAAAVQSSASAGTAAAPAAAAAPSGPIGIFPVALIAVAVIVISLSAVFIGINAFGTNQTKIPINTEEDGNDEKPEKTPKPSPSSSKEQIVNSPNNNETGSLGTSATPVVTTTNPPAPSGKKYTEMSDTEKRQYIAIKGVQIAQYIGNNSSEEMPANAVDAIKRFLDGYVSRINVKSSGGCEKMRPWGDSLQSTYERASKNAPFILRAFNERGVNPRVGLYLAMIESEHCNCLQSGTGPLGMFQFTFATAKLHFEPSDGVIKGAHPPDGDVRCKPEPAARAAASYMRALTLRFGGGTLSVPLAIGSYNSGEGGLNSNLQKTMDAVPSGSRDFWALVANDSNLSKQFQTENYKYVPKFFAAAIIGENPQDFSLNLLPLSSYSK